MTVQSPEQESAFDPAKTIIGKAVGGLKTQIETARDEVANRFSVFSDLADKVIPLADSKGVARVLKQTVRLAPAFLDWALAFTVSLPAVIVAPEAAKRRIERWKNFPEKIDGIQKLLPRLERLNRISEVAEGKLRAEAIIKAFPFQADVDGVFPDADIRKRSAIKGAIIRLEKIFAAELKELKRQDKQKTVLTAGTPQKPAPVAASQVPSARKQQTPAPASTPSAGATPADGAQPPNQQKPQSASGGAHPFGVKSSRSTKRSYKRSMPSIRL